MNNIEKHKAYRVKLNNGKTRIIDFYRTKSSAFQYGNQTSVSIEIDEIPFELYDTRYDTTVMGDFSKWCEVWIQNHFRKDLTPTWEELL